MLRDYFSGADVPDEGDPFPELGLSVDQTGLGKPMGFSNATMDLQLLSEKSIYKYCVVATHKHKLSNRRDLVWKERLQGFVPVWRLLYKPPLNKRTGDLLWRILQGALAVNSLIAKINSTVSENCPFCQKAETLVHCYLDCHRQSFIQYFKNCVFKLWRGLVGGCFYLWCWLR